MQNRVLGLDSARALAALSVMLAHIAGPSLPNPLNFIFTGAPAVTAFFVVSGLCIHLPYRRRPVPVLAFLSARGIRIMAPAIVAIGLAQAIGLREYNFIDGFILWSVVAEAIYYLAYPALAWCAERIGWRSLIAVSLAVSYALAIGIGSDRYGNVHVYGWYLNWVVMLPAWLLGCALADEATFEIAGSVWAWRAITALVASILYWLTMNTPAGFYLTLNPFAGLVAFWIAAEVRSARSAPSKLLEWIGSWSFSIYLVHFPAAVLLAQFHVNATVPAVALALLAALGFYYAVERPAHTLARLTFARLQARSLPRLIG